VTPARLDLALAPGSLEQLVDHVVEIAVERLRREASPWMTRAEAADYLHLPLSRLEKRRDIPCYRDERRVLYRRDELDAWLASRRDEGVS
jgi:hypothetical protein